MARFIPDVESENITHDSERIVYEALSSLEDGYVVLHSFPWLRPRRDLTSFPLVEGEADFVLLHKKKGLLVIEVKGGTPVLNDRRWYRGVNEMRDPFEQAQRNRFALLDAIEERTNNRLNRNMFTYGDAVVFPHCIYDGPLPMNTDPRILLDAEAIKDLPSKIGDVWKAWARKETNLTEAQFRDLQTALMPKLRLIPYLGGDIAGETARLVQITRDQQMTLIGLLSNRRVLVEGVAGSGKTLLAAEFLKQLCRQGKKVLFLCYNKNLADWLRDIVSKDREQDADGLAEISTFHSYAMKLARQSNVEFELPRVNSNQFWDDEVPLILEQAIDILNATGSDIAYDAVIVDEAQDFAFDWWVIVETLTRGGHSGHLYAFMDEKQSLRFEGVTKPPVSFDTVFPLTTNCRNTRAIAKTGIDLVGSDVNILESSPRGELPQLLRAPSPEAVPGIVINAIRGLLKAGIRASQIAVIGQPSYEKSPLTRLNITDEMPFVESASEWRDGGGILVTTSRAFKGLEADVVIVYLTSNLSQTFTMTDLYVAWTRAKSRLVVVTSDVEIRKQVEAVIANYQREFEWNEPNSQS